MTRVQRELIRQLETQVADLQAQLDTATSDDAADTALIDSLKGQVGVLSTQLVALNNQAALDDASIADLTAQLQACQEAANPNPPSVTWTETLRDTDGMTIRQAVAQLVKGDKLRLVGEFPETATIIPPADDITIGCNPGEAHVLATSAFSGKQLFDAKLGTGKGRKNLTLIDLDVDGQQHVQNVVGAWFGTQILRGRLARGQMTGMHAYTDGSPIDAGILMEDVLLEGNGSAAQEGHGAAGTKVFNTHGVTYRRVKATNTTGNAFWSDFHCGRVDYEDCDVDGATRRGFFREKCGRFGKPYPNAFVYGMYVPDFVRLGGVVIYDAPLTIQGGTVQGVGYESVLIVASVHARVGGLTLVNAGDIIVRNDPNRMNPIASQPGGTNPGWMVEDVVIDKSSCVLNGSRVVIQPNVTSEGSDKARVT